MPVASRWIRRDLTPAALPHGDHVGGHPRYADLRAVHTVSGSRSLAPPRVELAVPAEEGVDEADETVLHLEDLEDDRPVVVRVLRRRREVADGHDDAALDVGHVEAPVLDVPLDRRNLEFAAAAPRAAL